MGKIPCGRAPRGGNVMGESRERVIKKIREEQPAYWREQLLKTKERSHRIAEDEAEKHGGTTRKWPCSTQ
jgi:hypothetical protein